MALIFEERGSDSALIQTIWRTRSEKPGVFISTASGQSEIVITTYQGQTSFTVRGPETKATPAQYPADAEFFGIVFKTGAFMPPIPPKLLLNRNDLTLPNASRRSFWLQGAAWQFPTFENADTFVIRLIRAGVLAYDPIIETALAGLPVALSARALQARFVRATGVTQAYLRQLERAQKALALLQQGRSILDVIYELGYFDQPHLTNTLKRFFGQTPAQIAKHARTP